MGWLYMHRNPRFDGTVTDYFKRQFEYEGSHCRLIDGALVARTEFYGAVEYIDDEGFRPKGAVSAIVCLVKFCRGEYNFGYKDMDETMGPYVYRCPKRILDKLTPTDDKNANEWRAACRERIAKPKPKKGDTVRFAKAITFNNGAEADTFKYIEGARFTRLTPLGEGGLYRISGWKDRDYTVNPL